MNRSNDLERDLVRWMDAVAPRQAPDDLIPWVSGRTSGLRPRPGWLARLREPTMQTTLSLGSGRFGRPLAIGLTLLLMLVLLAAVVAFIGARLSNQQTLPPPFGLAQNGQIAFGEGKAIVFQNPDGSDVRRVELPFDYVSAITFSRDGTNVAAWSTASVPSNMYQLVVSSVDGSEARKIAPETTFSGPSGPLAWSPDGHRIAFSANDDVLYVADLEESRIDALGDPQIHGIEPAWSPDGRLAYKCDRDGALHLCVSEGDGSGERILPTSSGIDYAFQGSVWSNDGTRIAYYINDVDGSGGWDTVVMDVATGVERNLTRDTEVHTIYPVWTPDDQYLIVNTSKSAGIVAADGSGFRFASDLDCTGSVQTSPDGQFIACPTKGGIQVIPINGGDPVVLPDTASDGVVSWQRLGQ